MEEISNILVAIGFTRYSEGILRYAVGLARRFDARLVVGSVINSRDVQAVGRIASMGYDVDGEHYVEAVKTERRQVLQRYLDGIPEAPDTVRAIFRVGDPSDELLKMIVREEIDLVVMGVKGRSDLERVLVGSVAERLFRRSPVTVVSYRDPESAQRMRKRIHP